MRPSRIASVVPVASGHNGSSRTAHAKHDSHKGFAGAGHNEAEPHHRNHNQHEESGSAKKFMAWLRVCARDVWR